MRSTVALSVAALAGSALAAPSYNGYGNHKPVQNVHYDVVVETVIHTVYVTEGYEPYKPKPTSSEVKPVYQAPETTVVYQPAQPTTSSAVYSAPAYTPEAPAPTSTVVYTPAPAPTSEAPEPTTEAPAPEPTTGGYMDIVSEWRAKMGMKALESSAQLEANAQKVVEAGNGVMRHELNPGTFGQVLAPGEPDMESFLSVFVGGWLCEIPTLPGLDGVCSTMSQGWDYQGQTGHAEILTSDNYSQIGCRNYKGIWCCDLA